VRAGDAGIPSHERAFADLDGVSDREMRAGPGNGAGRWALLAGRRSGR
jgi:hypothetical protein